MGQIPLDKKSVFQLFSFSVLSIGFCLMNRIFNGRCFRFLCKEGDLVAIYMDRCDAHILFGKLVVDSIDDEMTIM